MKNAKISSLDYPKGLVKVEMTDKEKTVSDWIPLESREYDMPKIGDLVKVIFEEKGYGNCFQDGLCFRNFFNEKNLPKLSGKNIYYKIMLDDVTLIYNSTKKELKIQTEKKIIAKPQEEFLAQSDKIILEGQTISLKAQTVTIDAAEIIINGDTKINGNLAVSGAITAANIA